MAKIAIDVVLLPPEEIMNLAIKKNKQLIKRFGKKIELDKAEYIPHISLVMNSIDEIDLPEIKEKLKEISKQISALNLKIIGMDRFPDPEYKTVTSFQIERSQEIVKLHERITKEMEPYFTNDSDISLFYPSSDLKRVPNSWSKGLHRELVYENYNPHITLGAGEPEPLKEPVEFTASTLAIFHLGAHCTCRKELARFELK